MKKFNYFRAIVVVAAMRFCNQVKETVTLVIQKHFVQTNQKVQKVVIDKGFALIPRVKARYDNTVNKNEGR